MNAVQEELVNIVMRGGLVPDKTDRTQVLRALSSLFTGAWQSIRTTRDLLVPNWATQMAFILVGGGGAYCHSDGTNYQTGAGGAIEGQRPVAPGGTVNVVIGAGGESDTGGGSSSLAFGAEWVVTCTGGNPGLWYAPEGCSGGEGGEAVGDENLGDIVIASSCGGDGQYWNAVMFGNGNGAGGLWGGGGRAGTPYGLPGGGPGSGGGAYDTLARNIRFDGGRGANGILRYRFLP